MHEAGIAVAIAAEIRDRGLDPLRIQIVISGGHGDPVSFDAALRAHLEVTAPGLGLDSIGIVHAAAPHLCAHCANLFRDPAPDAACPACGGPALSVSEPESIELEFGDGPARSEVREWHDHNVHEPGSHPKAPAREGPNRPAARDSRPSASQVLDERLGI